MKIVIGSVQYLISERKKSGKKPEKFLLKVEPDNSRKYISSLFSTDDENIFTFDYSGIRYLLNIESKSIVRIKG